MKSATPHPSKGPALEMSGHPRPPARHSGASALLAVALLAGLICASGCMSKFGAKSMRKVHPSFNDAIVGSLNEQFLLNIVRLRYRDTPFFMDVSSVTTSQTLTGGAFFSTEIEGVSAPIPTFKPGVEGRISETPTVSYVPLQGEGFLKKVLTPLPLTALLVMTQSGWSIDRVFSLCLERINALDNATCASGPTPDYVPRHEEFMHLMEIMRELQKADVLKLGLDPAPGTRRRGGPAGLLMRFDRSQDWADKEQEAKELLGVPPDQMDFLFEDNFLSITDERLTVRTRSIDSILFYLSQAVEVPTKHEEAGYVTVTRLPDGSRFDWGKVSGRFFRVYCSEDNPEHAYVKVKHRGCWFFIADNDLNTKSTFLLLVQLFNLQAGQITTVSPALTIPVGGSGR